MRSGSIATIAIAVALYGAAPAAAQDGAYVNPYVGYYAFDESSFEAAFDRADVEESPILGARLGWSSGAWGIEAAYGRSRFETELRRDDVVFPDEETTIHLIYAATNWTLPLGPVRPFVSGGLGAVAYSPENRDGATDVLANFGGGLKVAFGERFRLRADVKDHVDLCEAPEFEEGEGSDDVGACFDDETLHNIEISGGVEIGL
ncbi:MAG: outer membrane beta-barrel protein [Gemmatimonadetes bacterium]|nr:outer membrane beta-barrel protein [Gemmatimonadota bacterium]